MNHHANVFTPVSSDSERLILVDSSDQALGTISKVDAHKGNGELHRAFSIFLFAGESHVLLQKRAMKKLLWPGYWTNSCCSHPREGETYAHATERRLEQELGIVDCPLHYIYTFEYSARYQDLGSEHELCSVYIATVSQSIEVSPHPDEVMDWQWFNCEEIDERVANHPDSLTPWFVLEWRELRGKQWPRVRSHISQLAS